jgi:hypothetical protein
MTQIYKAVDEEIVRKYGKIRTDATPILYAILAELVEARLCATKQLKSEPEQMLPELNLEQPKKSPQAKKKK